MPTFSIKRHYFDDAISTRTIATGLSEEEAKSHCKNPETSSSTCREPENVAHTEEFGSWFDSFVEE